MISLKRNKQKVYLCKKIYNTLKFEKPKLFSLNYRPTNSMSDRLTLGDDYSKFLRIKCTPDEARNFSSGDKCYIYVKPPKIHDDLCKNADYIVNGDPLITLNEGEVSLMKLSGKK